MLDIDWSIGSDSTRNLLIERTLKSALSIRSSRYMKITKANSESVYLKINLNRSKPLYQTPVSSISDKTISNVNLDTASYKSLQCTDFIPMLKNVATSIEEEVVALKLTDEELNTIDTRLKARRRLESGKPADGSTDRYVLLFNIVNPLTKNDVTLFLDRLHKDLFVIYGLKMLLDTNLTINNNFCIELDGHKIGSITEDNYNITVYFDVPTLEADDMCIQDCISSQADMKDENMYCKVITFTRDLPANIANTNYPVIYDKIQDVNQRDIQIARQDTIPLLWFNIGSIKNLTRTTNPKVSLPNFIIKSAGNNIFRPMYNGFTHKADTQFGFIIPLY